MEGRKGNLEEKGASSKNTKKRVIESDGSDAEAGPSNESKQTKIGLKSLKRLVKNAAYRLIMRTTPLEILGEGMLTCKLLQEPVLLKMTMR